MLLNLLFSNFNILRRNYFMYKFKKKKNLDLKPKRTENKRITPKKKKKNNKWKKSNIYSFALVNERLS